MSRQHAAVTVFSNILSRKKTMLPATSALRGGALVLATASPQLGTWILPAIACATSYALYNLCIKKASSSIDPILGGVLLQFMAALIGTVLWLVQKVVLKRTSPISKSGLAWSLAAGAAVGAAEVLSFVINGMGVQATQSIPITVGGSILVGTILGAVWLRERLTRTGWFGVLLIAAGIVLVGMDSGSSMGH
jgi:transporter family protein